MPGVVTEAAAQEGVAGGGAQAATILLHHSHSQQPAPATLQLVTIAVAGTHTPVHTSLDRSADRSNAPLLAAAAGFTPGFAKAMQLPDSPTPEQPASQPSSGSADYVSVEPDQEHEHENENENEHIFSSNPSYQVAGTIRTGSPAKRRRTGSTTSETPGGDSSIIGLSAGSSISSVPSDGTPLRASNTKIRGASRQWLRSVAESESGVDPSTATPPSAASVALGSTSAHSTSSASSTSSSLQHVGRAGWRRDSGDPVQFSLPSHQPHPPGGAGGAGAVVAAASATFRGQAHAAEAAAETTTPRPDIQTNPWSARDSSSEDSAPQHVDSPFDKHADATPARAYFSIPSHQPQHLPHQATGSVPTYPSHASTQPSPASVATRAHAAAEQQPQSHNTDAAIAFIGNYFYLLNS